MKTIRSSPILWPSTLDLSVQGDILSLVIYRSDADTVS